ncbi:MAG: hypothetical protein J6Z03_08325 [Erysipelotrichaceae bacterium]|nr:hypothetical protein [Erysipelotrichaceae bacterium]
MKKKKTNNTRWSIFLSIMIIIFAIILFFNAFFVAREVKSDLTYKNKCYGLNVLDDYFNNGEYYDLYIHTTKNKYVDEKPYVDISQYEAFGRFYHAYLMAKAYPDEPLYHQQMEREKKLITWKKIRNTVTILENDLKKQ